MSTAKATRIFGIRIGLDPKILIGGLVAFAAFLFWYNSRSSDEETSTTTSTTARPIEGVSTTGRPATSANSSRIAARRNNNSANDRSRLRLRPIDATRGDVDPTLRLDLLHRLNGVKFEPAQRSLFEIGAAAPSPQAALAAIKRPLITPTPLPQTQTAVPSGPLPLNIPLKYYGFVKPMEPGQANRGFFLDTLDKDNILIASEGQVLKQQYLVVELGPNTAKLEDTQRKQGQSLPVVPAAAQQP